MSEVVATTVPVNQNLIIANEVVQAIRTVVERNNLLKIAIKLLTWQFFALHMNRLV